MTVASTIVKQRLRERRLWLGWTALLGLTALHSVLFWHLPQSDDSGIYAYLSRAVANGLVLHRDIPFSSNSLGIYGTALAFKVAGPSLALYRLIHAAGLFFLVSTVFLIVSRDRNYARGFLAAALTGLFCVLPHISLDLGMNYIVWAIGFVLAGFAVQSSGARHREACSGALLAGAALIRETFIIAGIALFLYILVRETAGLARHRAQAPQRPFRPLLLFGAAFLMTLSINAVLLSCYGTWGSYFRDLFQSGASFRYQSGFFDPARLSDNLSRLRHGFQSYYYPVVLVAALSYLLPPKDRFFSCARFLLVPVFLVEAVVVNKSFEYHIMPILALACILSSYALFGARDLAAGFWSPRSWWLSGARLAALLLLLPFIVTGIWGCGQRTAREFSTYHDLSRTMSRTAPADSSEHTQRLLYVVDFLPHSTVSAVAEFPFLFQADEFYGTSPFVQDLTAAGNMNRPDLLEAQLSYLRDTPTDLLILKTTATYLPKTTEIGQIADQNYVVVCDFPFAWGGSCPYRERVLLSRSAFSRAYVPWKEETAEGAYTGLNDRDEGIIVSVTTRVPEMIAYCSITANLSRTAWAPQYTDYPVIYSLVPPGTAFQVDAAGADGVDGQFQVRYYVNNEQ